jgi:hypothetical protein
MMDIEVDDRADDQQQTEQRAHSWWLVAAAVPFAGWYYWRVFQLACQMTAEAEAKRQADIAARADQQHAWALAGDDRGLCGQFPPAAPNT